MKLASPNYRLSWLTGPYLMTHSKEHGAPRLLLRGAPGGDWAVGIFFITG